MGVARSLQGCLAVGLHEHEHSEIYFGRVFSSEDAYEPQKIDNMFLHRLANEVVRLASAYGSQIILYTLGEKNDLLAFEDAKPLLNMREYNLLADLVSYKAELNGLPRPIKISPARVFHTCPVCGSNSRKNRMNRELFLCTGCGYIRNVEELGARNLALMIRTYEKNRIVFKTTKHEGSIRFTNAILGFEYESPLDEYAFDRFLEALRQSIADTHGISKQRLSIHKKLARLNDVRDGIRLVES
jgi:putative transposase